MHCLGALLGLFLEQPEHQPAPKMEHISNLFGERLLRAAYVGDWSAIEEALQNGADINTVLPQVFNNKTAIHVAIMQKHWDVALRLLDVPEIDLEAQDEDGDTPILIACGWGNLPLFLKLKSLGANLQHRNGKGKTALHLLLYRAHLLIYSPNALNSFAEIVRELIHHSSNLMYCVDNDGDTPLDLALTHLGLFAVRDMLTAYRDQIILQHGNRSLHFILQNILHDHVGAAAGRQQEQQQQRIRMKTQLGALSVETFRTLLQLFPPAFIQTRDSSGRLPLHVAAAKGVAVEFLRTLLFRDACRVTDNTGALPIHHACRASAALAVIEYLVDTGGVHTIQKRDLEGCLPLHLVIKQGAPRLEVIKYLVKLYSASLSVRTMSGDLPLTLAGASSSLDVFNFLLRQHPEVIEFPEEATGAREAAIGLPSPSSQEIDAALGVLRHQIELFNTSEEVMRALELLEQHVPRLPKKLPRS